jgi:hypothetical protein
MKREKGKLLTQQNKVPLGLQQKELLKVGKGLVARLLVVMVVVVMFGLVRIEEVMGI